MSTKKILLDRNDFEALTGGKIIEKKGLKIALIDIGYEVMLEVIKQHYKRLLKDYFTD